MTFARTQHLFAQLEDGSGYKQTHDSEVLNPYMNWANQNTQTFARLMVSEAVQARGTEMFYIRRESVNYDTLFGEDLQAKFEKAYRVAMYIQNFESYEGQQSFFSKFGMQVNDELTCIISPELFRVQCDGERAKEGDLIYFPTNKALFEIIWVEPNAAFFQVGQESQYRITAQKFIYSGEKLNPSFDAKDFLFDGELDPIKNLDGRLDTAVVEFDEDDDITNEGDSFIDEFEVANGRGIHPINQPNKQPVPVQDINDSNSPFSDF
jgi:hypothetical protein